MRYKFLLIIGLMLILAGCESQKHSHTYDEKWVSDANYHWHNASYSNDVSSIKKAHVWSSWEKNLESDLSKRTCLLCNYSEEVKQYDVTFVVDNNNTFTEQSDGQKIKLPTIEKENAVFEGWFLEPNYLTVFDGENITQDITVYARYSSDLGLVFEKVGNSYEVTDYLGYATCVKIPETHDGLAVNRIDDFAFYNTNVQEVYVPSTITSIGFGAFYKCEYLTKLTLPFIGASLEDARFNTLDYIFGNIDSKTINESYSLGGKYIVLSPFMPNLRELVLLDGVESLFENYFKYHLDKLVLPKTIKNIDSFWYSSVVAKNIYYEGLWEDWCQLLLESPLKYSEHLFVLNDNKAYYDVSLVDELVIPETLDEIAPRQFSFFKNMTKITIPAHVEKIGARSFAGCASLKSITIPSRVKEIEANAFYECESLQDVYYNGSISDWLSIIFVQPLLPGHALSPATNPLYYADIFYIWEDNQYQKLEELVIPIGTESINEIQFVGYKGLKTVIFSEKVKLYDGAFVFCDNLSKVVLPKKQLVYVGPVSGVCWPDFIETTYYPATFDEWAKNNCSIPFETKSLNFLNENNEYYQLQELVIPKDVTIISNQTYNLSNITSLVVHENVEKIESTALNKCVNLQTVIIYSHDILIESYTFANCVNLEALYFHGNISEYQKLNEYMGLSNKVKIYILDDNDNYILYEK